MLDVGREARKVNCPNSTRSGGMILHYEDSLRSRWNYEAFWHEEPRALSQTDDEYWIVAQHHSILYPTKILLMQVQSDNFGAISYTVYFIFRTFAILVTCSNYWVVETRRREIVDKAAKWSAEAMLPVMKFDGTPIYPKPILEGTGPNKICHVPGSPTQVSMKKVNKEEFHDLSKKLIGRLTAERSMLGMAPT
ncbi:unknown protein [Seminavis robusta]|uniref:Uncharacterized protein n=1 Tax=Seminavis robusta TaxID=568900 RepID=A0A9N8H588_9STRA|nr:unknown protein [Seminavis robusta]|eukprot:Sro19_g013770.1 n/a (193) ;mRNA; r:175140-175718